MTGSPERSPGALAIELLDAMRIARATGGLLLDHSLLAAELVRLDWQEEKARLKQLILINLLGATLVGLTLLHASALAIAAAWDTPYRLYVMAALLLLFAAATWFAWKRLQRLSDEGDRQFEASREQIQKTIDLLKRHL